MPQNIHSEGDRRINWSRVPFLAVENANRNFGRFNESLDKYIDIYVNGKWEPYQKEHFKGRVRR